MLTLTEQYTQDRLTRLASRGGGQNGHIQPTPVQSEPPLSVEFTLFDTSVNPTPGSLVVKDYMFDAFCNDHPDRTEAVCKFRDEAMMFFLLQERAQYLHHWCSPTPETVFDGVSDKKIAISKLDFAQYVYNTYLSYTLVNDSELDTALQTCPERVSFMACDCEVIRQPGILVAFYTGNGTPYIVTLDTERLSPTMLHIIYNSIKIGYNFKASCDVLKQYGVTYLSGTLFDVCASYRLLFGKEHIPGFDEVSQFYQFAHWKAGFDVLPTIADTAVRTEALYLMLANQVREMFLIRNAIVPYLAQRKIMHLFKQLNGNLDVIYEKHSS